MASTSPAPNSHLPSNRVSPPSSRDPAASSYANSEAENADRILSDLSEKLADVAPTPHTPSGSPTTHLPPEVLKSRPEVPIYMLFGTGPHEVCGTIYDKSLRRLSTPVLAKLLAKGHMNGTICIADNYKQCESMLRVQSYINTGRYKPFGPIANIECLDTENNIKVWQPGKELRLDAIRLTEPTFQLFMHEVDLYLFAVEIQYDSLRLKSSSHIIQDYPKNLKAILALLNKIYPVATRLNDTRLVTHIEKLVSTNSKSLAKVPQYTEIMNVCIQAKNLGQVMLDAYIAAANEANKKVAELTKREATLATRRDVPRPPDAPVRRIEMFWPDYLHMFAEAVKDNCVVVAKEAGYGTLIKKGAPIRSRNRDFTFKPGELLIVSTDVSNTYNNIMVYNGLGQKGDILKTLVRVVPPKLGIEGKFDVVNAPRMILLDRETRLSRLRRGERGRSRSPLRRNRQYDSDSARLRVVGQGI